MKVRIKSATGFERLIDDLEAAAGGMPGVMDDVEMAAAETLKIRIQNAIEQGSPDWPELSKVTVTLKGHSRALEDTGTLKNSITVVKLDGSVLVGIPDEAVYPDGTPVSDIASLMEDGASIEVTDKMRGFMAAKGFPLRKETKYIVIPARSFFERALAEFETEDLPGIVEKASEKLLG